MRKLRPFLFLAALCALPSGASAQIKAEHPRFCVMSVGPTQMMFSAFQENGADEIFCQHIPRLGPTYIILDARQPELRDMNVEVRIVRDVGQKDWRDDLDANTVATLPAQKHLKDRGTLRFSADLAKEGDYFALVKATSDDGLKEYVGQYQFSAGESGAWVMASGAVAAAMAFVAFGIWRRDKGAAPAVGSAGKGSVAVAPAARPASFETHAPQDEGQGG